MLSPASCPEPTPVLLVEALEPRIAPAALIDAAVPSSITAVTVGTLLVGSEFLEKLFHAVVIQERSIPKSKTPPPNPAYPPNELRSRAINHNRPHRIPAVFRL